MNSSDTNHACLCWKLASQTINNYVNEFILWDNIIAFEI